MTSDGTKPVEEGAQIIVRMAELDQAGPSGTFTDEQGAVPWKAWFSVLVWVSLVALARPSSPRSGCCRLGL